MVKSMVNDFYTEDNVGVGIGVEFEILGAEMGTICHFVHRGGRGPVENFSECFKIRHLKKSFQTKSNNVFPQIPFCLHVNIFTLILLLLNIFIFSFVVVFSSFMIYVQYLHIHVFSNKYHFS